MTKFLAWIIPVTDGGAGEPGVPTHPIVLPPEIGGGPVFPPEIGGGPILPPDIPGTPTHPIVIPPEGLGPGVPTHPIVLPPFPSHDLPKPPGPVDPGFGIPIVGTPEHPIWLPSPPSGNRPSHPIAGVPMPTPPIYYPVPPPADPLRPTHPIVLPPPGNGEGAGDNVAVVVAIPGGENLTPPSGVPAGNVPCILWFGEGTLPSLIWVPPPATPKTSGGMFKK